MAWTLAAPLSGLAWYYGRKAGHPVERLVLVRIRDGCVYSLRAGAFFAYVDELPGLWAAVVPPDRTTVGLD